MVQRYSKWVVFTLPLMAFAGCGDRSESVTPQSITPQTVTPQTVTPQSPASGSPTFDARVRRLLEEDAQSIESLFRSYYAAPGMAQLQFVSRQREATPLMRVWRQKTDGVKLDLLKVDLLKVDLLGPPAKDGSRWVSVTTAVANASSTTRKYRIVRATSGYKVDWITSLDWPLKWEGIVPWGVISRKDDVPIVLEKTIATVPERYYNKRVKMINATFMGLADTYVSALPNVRISTNGLLTVVDKAEYEKWFGIVINDSDGKPFHKVLCPKPLGVDTFLSLTKGVKLNLIGYLVDLRNLTGGGFVVTGFEYLNPPPTYCEIRGQ